MKKPLIVIAGPTASGKTEFSIKLAQKLNGAIISADSMQVYKYMDIGTAKIMPHEMGGIDHYLVDEILPNEDYSVAVFTKKANEYIDKIIEQGKIPILVGGTGFYINALIYNNDFANEDNDLAYRNTLTQIANTKGSQYIYDMLQEIDPESCVGLHHHNIKRVIRALEYFKLNGQKMSEHNKIAKEKELFYHVDFFTLNMDRKILYERIDKRVDIMIEKGLVKEVENLLKMGYLRNLVSMQGLGYKEIVAYLLKETSLDYAIDLIKKDTRHFAKRQLTWFRNKTNGNVIEVDKFENVDSIVKYAVDIINQNKQKDMVE